MSLFMDVHNIEGGVSAADVAAAHDVVRDWNENRTAAPGTEVVGRSRLVRTERGLKATVRVKGLIPGGVYTFW